MTLAYLVARKVVQLILKIAEASVAAVVTEMSFDGQDPNWSGLNSVHVCIQVSPTMQCSSNAQQFRRLKTKPKQFRSM